MEKCTLESIYDLIIVYFVIHKSMQFNMYFVNTHRIIAPIQLHLTSYPNDHSLRWFDMENIKDYNDTWDHEMIIEKWV